MYNIYELMQNGQSADEIAKAFTAELNAAISKKTAEDEKAAQEKLKADKKIEAAQNVCDIVGEYLCKYYPNLCGDNKPLTGEELVKFLDSLESLNHSLGKLSLTMFDKAPVKTGDSINDVFDRFFAKYNL